MPRRPATRSRPSAARSNPSIHIAFGALQERLKQLEDAFNTNTKVFSDGIQMLEAENAVLRRVCTALFNGDAVHSAPGGIDFNAYLKEYIEELAAKEQAAENGKAASPIVVPSDEDTVVFGGDGST